MSRSLEGLLAFNALLLLAGSGLLWGLRGWNAWGTYVRDLGIAYMLGFSTVAVAATVVLSLGGGLSFTALLLLTLVPAAAGIGAGILRRRPIPAVHGWGWLPRRPGDLVTVLPAAAVAAILFELARVMRSQALGAWDAWTFWLPKAKAIYFFGGLDEHTFREVVAQSYPLLVPSVDAAAFRFMGSADTVTLGIQYWLLFLGFLLAAASLLRGLSRSSLVWLFLASAAALPELDRLLPARLADWPLDMFFALSALALLRWLTTREPAILALYGVMLAALLATKREGQYFALAVVAGGVAGAGLRDRRRWGPLVAVAVAAYAVNLPWRIWWSSRHLQPDTPPGGILHATFHFDRILPSLWLALRILVDFQMWQLAFPLAIAAALLSSTTGHAERARFFLTCAAISILGTAWATWSTGIPITSNGAVNPTPRASGALALLSLVFAPALLEKALAEARLPAVVGRLLRRPAPAPGVAGPGP